jgi:hypothetical protein
MTDQLKFSTEDACQSEFFFAADPAVIAEKGSFTLALTG